MKTDFELELHAKDWMYHATGVFPENVLVDVIVASWKAGDAVIIIARPEKYVVMPCNVDVVKLLS